ncbi:hypothetical protein HMI54_014748 [Coelomomyces lativittatus]|nr:hypothetical protein HMI56_004413 [Coelomomyces lativittatus]KAJ1513131.1 hypothetical protein HMI55_005877 [Coelomomyces lativittatus]KAJ1513728.1 hypothetical protein HMI54_014748 [Coelomomyces lativittatus]
MLESKHSLQTELRSSASGTIVQGPAYGVPPFIHGSPKLQACSEIEEISSFLHSSSIPTLDMRPFSFLSFNSQHVTILPFTQFQSSQHFPWFLLPPKNKPFHLIFPLFNVSTLKWSDGLLRVHSLWKMGKEPIPLNWIWDTSHDLFERYVAFLYFLQQKNWQPHTVYLVNCVSKPIPITVSSLESKCHLPFEPCPILLPSIKKMNQDPEFCHSTWTVLDIGCGTGRDLAWIAHVYPNRLKLGIGIDKWKQTIDRAILLKKWMQLKSVNYLVMELKRSESIIKTRKKNKVIPQKDIQPLSSCTPQLTCLPCSQFNFLLLNRMLPPRTFIPQLHDWIQIGGYICISTFIQLPEVPLHSPQHVKFILQPDELIRPINWKLLNQSEESIWHQLDHFGWGFNPENGYEIMKNEVVYIEDGRPVTWFLAKKK